MTMFDSSDLHKRVSRYEAALDELRAAHQDIRHVLHDQVLYERWQQIGVELGFVAPPVAQAAAVPANAQQPDPAQQVPQMAEAWAG